MKKIAVLLVTALGLAGCPDKNSGNNNVNGNVGVLNGTCVDCGFNPAVFNQQVTSYLPQGEMTLTISGDANQMNVWANNAQNPLFTYQGPVKVEGQLIVYEGLYLPFGFCQLPAGTYRVNTQYAGTYNRGIFQVPTVQFIDVNTGLLNMTAALREGGVLTSGSGIITGFSAIFFAQLGRSNFSGWGYPQQLQGQNLSSCSDGIGVRF
jgi:hypothetical protein